MAETKSKTTTLRWPPSLLRRVDTAARKSGISRNQFVELVLNDYLESKTPRELRLMALDAMKDGSEGCA